MIAKKERVTITIDAHLLDAANRAVTSGMADSVSGWINLALAERLAKERRLAAIGDAVAAYEERFGEITAEEIAAQRRADRSAATVVRGPGKAAARRKARAGAARLPRAAVDAV